MAVGTLNFGNNLNGVQPIYISNGGNATMIGRPDVPQIKSIHNQIQGNATITPTKIETTQDFIFSLTSCSTGQTSSGTLTVNGNSTQFAHNSDSQTKAYGAIIGDYYIPEYTSGGFQISDAINSYNTTSSTFDLIPIKNSYQFDYLNTPTQTTIKTASTDLTNPTTGFSTYGTEFTSTQYSNTKDVTDTTYTTINPGNYVITKFTSIESTLKILPLIKAQFYVSGSLPYTLTENLYLWNFTTNSWDSVNSNTINQSASTGGSSMGSYQYFPWGKIKNSSDYLSGGIIYTKLYVSGAGHLNVGYIGLLTFNGFLNSQ